MLRLLPLAVAITLAGAGPAAAVTLVKVDYRAGPIAHMPAPHPAPARPSPEPAPQTATDSANWALLFGGIALIAALRMGRRQAQVCS